MQKQTEKKTTQFNMEIHRIYLRYYPPGLCPLQKNSIGNSIYSTKQ